ncbi:Quinidine resistance protein 1 [Cytospora mali]|uniref:Quinidine resistance protein 1 n=1 Tax=Cytospora mali TaxID=578113 RepID=A0A194VTC0_CYTMA|nr:Quinidine resistance protein 1 [Valsa mali]
MSDTKLKGEQSPDQSAPPFTVFSPAQKKAIAFQTAFSATFSGLSSFIYYPAIRPLAEDLEVSVAAINLTVSAYLIVAGIFPSIIGDISDQSGRRVASLLASTLYFSANLGIALQDSYAALVVLRCLQSAGSAGTIAISYGVIADITTPAERGSGKRLSSTAVKAQPHIMVMSKSTKGPGARTLMLALLSSLGQ